MKSRTAGLVLAAAVAPLVPGATQADAAAVVVATGSTESDSAQQAPLGPTCGVSVTHGAWVATPGASGHETRTWSWQYYNCGPTAVRRKVVVGNGSDSACFYIPRSNWVTYQNTEKRSPGHHLDWYSKTTPC